MKYLVLFLISFNCFAMCGSSYDPIKSSDFEKSKLEFNGQKVMGVVPGNDSFDIDYAVTDDVLLTGAKVVINGNCIGDTVKFQVVHPTLGVLKTFIDWYATDLEKEFIYPAKVVCGLTLRLKYTNTCATPVTVRTNLSLHKVLQ